MSRQLLNDNGFEEAMKFASPVQQPSTSPNSNPEPDGRNEYPQDESKLKNQNKFLKNLLAILLVLGGGIALHNHFKNRKIDKDSR